MPPRPVNPTPPILLTLVTLLFAVTWSYDQPAGATDCRSRPLAAAVVSVPDDAAVLTSGEPSEVLSVEPSVEPQPTITRTSLTTTSGHNARNVLPITRHDPSTLRKLELRRLSVPQIDMAQDWLSRLIAQAEQHIQR
ncbi:MAG: hypothetical protein ACK5Q5_13975 [Planctomycetaceae bacterium]